MLLRKFVAITSLVTLTAFSSIEYVSGAATKEQTILNAEINTNGFEKRNHVRSSRDFDLALKTTQEEQSAERNLQFNLFGSLQDLVANSVSVGVSSGGLILGVSATLLANVVELGVKVVTEIAENGMNVDTIVDIVAEQIATAGGELAGLIVSFVADNFNGVLNSFVKALLESSDPFEFEVDEDPVIFSVNESICNYTYNVTDGRAIGGANTNIEELEFRDFDYEDNVFSFGAKVKLSAEKITVELDGFVVDTCTGDTEQYTATFILDDLSAEADVTMGGSVTNGTNMTIDEAEFSSLSGEGYEDYELTVTELDSKAVESGLISAFVELTSSSIDELNSALTNTSTFLSTVGVEFPTSFELPIPIPF